MRWYSSTYTREQLTEHIGDMRQVLGVMPVKLTDGAEQDVRALHVWNASGLQLWLLPDRGLDIGMVHLGGMPISWLSKTGYVHPALLGNGHGAGGWSAGFYGGLLATCGLNNVGAACKDGDEMLEQHGRYTRLMASAVKHEVCWEGDRPWIVIEGTMNDVNARGYHLRLTRRIRIRGDEAVLEWQDTVENLGCEVAPCMIQYHMNFGFPFITERTVIEHVNKQGESFSREVDLVATYDSARSIEYGTVGAEEKEKEVEKEEEAREEVQERQNWGGVTLRTPSTSQSSETSVAIQFDASTLPYLWQWQDNRPGMRVLSIEPSNCLVKPRSEARESGVLPLLEPGQCVQFSIRVCMCS